MNQVEKTQELANTWFKKTERVRSNRFNMLRHVANGWYTGDFSSAGRTPQPINLIDRGVQIILPYLVVHNPRVKITPRFGLQNINVRPFALTMELALTHLFSEINLAQRTLRPVVIDSLFGMGITRTGTVHTHSLRAPDYLEEYGQPYCDRVDFNDYIGDIAARNKEEMQIEGDRFRLPYSYVAESGLFKNYDKLRVISGIADSTSIERITKPQATKTELFDLHKMIELQHIWLPREGIVQILPLESEQGTKSLMEFEWDGPETGPYDTLAYKPFADSIIPIPPVYIWMDINKTVNIIVKKMEQMCEQEKTIGIYQKGDSLDAEVVRDAKHGGLYGLDTPDSVKEVTFGGFNDQSFPFLQWLDHQFAVSYSNLYGLGGQQAQAETLGQEQMLLANAGRAIQDMSIEFRRFVKSISSKLAYFLWTDPLKQIPVIKRVAGIEIDTQYSQSVQENDFWDYTFEIEPYSMSEMNPEMKSQKLVQILTGVIMPLLPEAKMQGTTLNVAALVNDLVQQMGFNDISHWWQTAVPTEQENPYSPEQAQITPKKSAQVNDSMGADLSSRLANSQQFQSSDRAGKSSPPNKVKK